MGQSRYNGVAIAFHWLIALLIVTNVGLAWSWDYVAEDSVRPLINNHKTIGITILALVTMRLLWRVTHPVPPLPAHHKTWEKRAAHAVHIALYLIMFALPLSGWIMDSAYKDAASHPNLYFGLFEWPRLGFVMALDPATKKSVHDIFGQTHEISATILYALVFVHIAGALKHQFIDKDRELARMGLGKADA
jgi:cytochrome b561